MGDILKWHYHKYLIIQLILGFALFCFGSMRGSSSPSYFLFQTLRKVERYNEDPYSFHSDSLLLLTLSIHPSMHTHTHTYIIRVCVCVRIKICWTTWKCYKHLDASSLKYCRIHLLKKNLILQNYIIIVKKKFLNLVSNKISNSNILKCPAPF